MGPRCPNSYGPTKRARSDRPDGLNIHMVRNMSSDIMLKSLYHDSLSQLYNRSKSVPFKVFEYK